MRKVFVFFTIIINHAFASPIISNLVDPVGYFTGRETEFDLIKQKLIKFKSVSLVGFSGIGKTQLIRTYAHRNHDKYDIIWFFDCDRDLDGQFSILAKALNSKYKNLNLCEDQNAKRDVLEYFTSKQRWLLVFDNIRLAQNKLVEFLADWDHNGHFVVSSQDAEGLKHIVHLSYLSEDEAKTLAKKLLPEKNIKEIEELSSLFFGYPYLIVQGALLLNDAKFLTVSDYAKLISRNNSKINNHINLVLKRLSFSAKKLLYRIVFVQNGRISKETISRVTEVPANFIKDLNELVRYGLLVNSYEDKYNVIFEMHDATREAIVSFLTKEEIVGYIYDDITRINYSFPKGSISRYLLFSKDKTLLSNFEALKANAKIYKIQDSYELLILQRHLMVYYLFSRENEKFKEIQTWFNSRDHVTKYMSNENKAYYSECLFLSGVYEYIFNVNIKKAFDNMLMAKDIVESIDNEPELKVSIYGQLAQMYITVADLDKTSENLDKLKSTKNKYSNLDASMRLYYLVMSKVSLSKGNYEESLELIKKMVAEDKKSGLTTETFTISAELMMAKVYNFMAKYHLAKKIAVNVYNRESKKFDQKHETIVKALIEIAIAETNINKNSVLALTYANQAIEALSCDNSRNNKNILISQDITLARAHLAHAIVLSNLGKLNEARDSYILAETIYYNTWRDNIKNMDEISDLYFNAAKSNINDVFWFDKFEKQHLKYFGLNHPRSKILLQLKNNKRDF